MGSSQSSPQINKIEKQSSHHNKFFNLYIKRKRDDNNNDKDENSDNEQFSSSNKKNKVDNTKYNENSNTIDNSLKNINKDNINMTEKEVLNTTLPQKQQNSEPTVRKKRGRKPIFKNPSIIDPSIYNNKSIQGAKRENKQNRNERRVGEDVQYDLELENTNTSKKANKDTTIYDVFKAISMLKDNKEYNLFDALNNTNAGITFAQLFNVSPSLRKLCSKGLKLNKDDVRYIKMIQNFPVNDEELVQETLDELDYVVENNVVNVSNSEGTIATINQIYDKEKKNKVSIAVVLGEIDESPAKVLIDTGSDVNAITRSFYNKISNNHKIELKHKAYFKLASNQIVSTNYAVYLKLKFINLEVNEMFWILDDEDMCYDVILGRCTQKEHRLYIDPDDDGLYKKHDSGASCIAVSVYHHEEINNISKISFIDNLSEEVKKELHPKLRRLINKFSDVLINSIDNVKIANAEPHTIHLTNNHPIKLRPYKISLDQSRALKKEITKLLKRGLIIPSHSPWAFPVLLVRKKNGEWRMCIDFRKLNEITVKDAYALPFIDELLESVHGATIFSALDLFSGYHQIPMNPDDIEKTSFTTKFGNYCFKVMPFGLTNAPASFQREMNRILMPLIGKCLFVYMDDILVYSPTFEQHLIDLENVFSILRKYNFSINLDKCKFCQHSVEVLGHVLSDQGLQPVPNKVCAIASWKIPTNVSQLQSFLGLVGYYRKFIPNFASLSNILYKLTSNKVKFIWTEEHTTAFNALRDSLCHHPILKYPDPNKPFIIRTDASSYAISAVLLQYYDTDEKEFPIYFQSRCLKKAELNYSVTEKEGLAIIFALKKFRPYIVASYFVVKLFTDHKPLLGYFKTSIPSSERHLRWISLFNEMKVELLYEKGKNNIFADALSRLPSGNVLSINTIKDISRGISSTSDSIPAPILDYVNKNYSFLNGKLVYKDKSNMLLQVIENESQKQDIVLKAHLVGHEGVSRTLARIKECYYWPGLKSDVEKVVKTCLKCQCYRPSPIPKYTSTIPTQVSRPFVRVGLDIIGPLSTTLKGNKYLFVLVDYFTKWVEAKATKTIDAKDVIQFLKDIFSRHGLPEVIITDNGRQFISDITKAMVDLYGSWIRFITPRHPEANGQVENTNHEIEKVLRYICDKQENWDELLPSALWALRTSKSSVTGFSNFELLYGRKDLWPLSVLLPDLNKEENETELEYNVRRFIRHQQWVEEAINNIQYAHSYWLERSKSARNMLHKYKPGDLVLIRYVNRKKLDRFFIGPFKVLKASKYNTLVLQTLKDKQILERNVHIKDVKPYLVTI